MKNIYLTIILVLEISKMCGQTWEWVKPITNTNTICSDTKLKRSASGKLAVYMYKWDTPAYTDLIFCNANGDTLWKKHFVNLTIRDICFDANENLYFAGSFTDTTRIGGTTFVSSGSNDGIAGMFDNTGSLLKYKTLSSIADESACSLALNSSQVVVTGTFSNSFSVDTVHVNFNSPNTYEAYIVQFDLNFMAIKGFQTTAGGVQAQAIALDKYNYIYLLGESYSSATLADTTVYIFEYGQILAKFSPNLDMQWVECLTGYWGSGNYHPYILFDSNNNMIMEFTLGGGGGSTNYLRVDKCTSNGTPIWSKQVSINGGCFIDLDGQDNIWIAGRDVFFSASDNFSILKLSPTGTQTQVIYDSTIHHGLEGFAVKADNDFYILGDCAPGSNLGSYSCSVQGSEFIAHYGLTTGTKNINETDNVSIYPNPCETELTICVPFVVNNSSIEIHNALGQLVLVEKLNKKEFFINVSNVEKGIYQLRVIKDNKTIANKKFIKE